jgi:hypothetical protein
LGRKVSSVSAGLPGARAATAYRSCAAASA